MAIQPYLAMTAAQMLRNPGISRNAAWMACRFSLIGPGLSNLPEYLPPESLLMLTDETPWYRHDPERILSQLRECLETFSCPGLLLDFQRPGEDALSELTENLAQALPCPVIVSAPYAREDCPVLLPPVPASVPVVDWLRPWKGREIWLELALDGQCITLTEAGASARDLLLGENGSGWEDPTLCCHYRVETQPDAARFTLWRSREDLSKLLLQAEAAGISGAVGFWEELC